MKKKIHRKSSPVEVLQEDNIKESTNRLQEQHPANQGTKTMEEAEKGVEALNSKSANNDYDDDDEDWMPDSTDRGAPSISSSDPPAVSQQRDEVKEIEHYIQQETQTVRLWRGVVLLAMIVVAAGVTTATYLFLRNEETSDFENSVRCLLVDLNFATRFPMR